MPEEAKKSYFKNINNFLNIQQIVDSIQYGADATIDHNSFIEREKEERRRMIRSLRMRNCNSEEIINVFEQYGEIMQEVYFEVGVQIGISMQTELLLKHEGMEERKKLMTLGEFKDRIFDVINESNELMIRDLDVGEESGDIVVSLQDGSQFVVKCEEK